MNDCSGTLPGFVCTGGSTTSVDICVPQCNDGYIRMTESCEDGNLISGDGCSTSC